MKILLISDIHSNFPALEAVWKRESDSDLILCAGDLVDWGLYPREVLNWCRDHKVVSVAGNHDRYICRLFRQAQAGSPPPAGTLAAMNLERLDEEDIRWLEALPDNRRVRAGNASFDLRHCYQEEEDRHRLLKRWERCESRMAFDEIWMDDDDAHVRVAVTGHSHQCCLFQVDDGMFFLNPGSLAYRVCSDSHTKGAQYAVYQDGNFFLHHLDYDRSVFIPLLEQANLSDHVRKESMYYLVTDCPDSGSEEAGGNPNQDK